MKKNQIFVRKSIGNDKIEILNGRFFLKNHPFLQLIMQYLKNAFMHFGVKIQSLLVKTLKEKIREQKRK